MADAKSFAPAQPFGPVPDAFDPEKMYKINLNQNVKVLGQELSPLHPPTLRGDLCETIRANIVGAMVV